MSSVTLHCHCTSVFISFTSDTWYDAGESQGMSSLWIIIFYFGSSYITLIKRFFVSTVQLKSWGFDICLYEIIEICICYIEKARSCYWMTVTNQLLHGPPHHLCAHLVALCHIVPSQLCWHESQVVMCQNNFDIKVSQFFFNYGFVFFCWSQQQYKQNNVETWQNLFIPVSHHISFSTLKGFSLDKFLSFF